MKHFGLIADAGHFAAFLQPAQFLHKLLLYVRPLSEAPSSAAMGVKSISSAGLSKMDA
jgi:hypothetical protein